MEAISDLLPESRFVHLIRDGRDVALSLLSRRYAPRDVAGASLFWQRRVRAGCRGGRLLGPGRYLEVRYEDLLDDTEGGLRRICRFLELEFDPSMLSYYRRSAQVLAGVPRPDHHANVGRPPTRGLRDWRTQMSPGDLAMAEALVGRSLEALGYELVAPGSSAMLRLGAARARLALGVRSAAGSVRSRVHV
jgi:hypothetical protein